MGSCIGKEGSSSRSSSRQRRPSLTPLIIEQNDGGGTINQAQQRRAPSQRHTIPIQVLRSMVLIQLHDDPSPSNCPYCEQPGMDISNMMVCSSEHMPYDMFEKLMERGWWRTGNIIFQPQLESVCCPSFAIRLPVSEYKLTKKHRKVLNNWKQFLLYGDPRWENRNSNPNCEDLVILDPSNASNLTPTQMDSTPTQTNPTPTQINPTPTQKGPVRKGEGPDPLKPPCMKAKARRRQKAQEKCSNAKRPQTQNLTSPSLLEMLNEHEELLNETTPKHKLEIKLIQVKDTEIKNSLEDFFRVYNLFQDGVHPGKPKFTSVFDLNWAFVSSPLDPSSPGGPPLGTYHMRYYLDGELFMLSVIDILPRYLVSIYFIYDPAIRFLEPGIYTCLQEIALIQRLQKEWPQLVYYNLGFFNDFSQKISYKKQFKPTQILCPITDTYVPLEGVLPLLKETRYCRFASDELPRRPDADEQDIDDVHILDKSSMTGYYFKDLSPDVQRSLRPKIQRYMRVTGADVMAGMLLSF